MKILKMFTIFNFSSADIKKCFRIYPQFKSFYLHTSLPTSVKKMMCILLMISLLLSGILPKNQEIKNNFITALNCAVNNIQTSFCETYSSVVRYSIKFVTKTSNIKSLAQAQLAKQKTQNEGNKTQPANTSADDAIILQNNIKVQTDNILKAKQIYLTYETTNKLYNGYDTIKITFNEKASKIGILFFILFSILVVRIKDTIAVINKNRIIGKKPAWLV